MCINVFDVMVGDSLFGCLRDIERLKYLRVLSYMCAADRVASHYTLGFVKSYQKKAKCLVASSKSLFMHACYQSWSSSNGFDTVSRRPWGFDSVSGWVVCSV
eukprot:m.207973 g.207973  ORF g.207973 m.207973 type:complete len:102 (-) comp15036_c0_seq2:764-1069(-)